MSEALSRAWDSAVEEGGVAAEINSAWRNALTPPRRDPLGIDLDGDGIETVGVAGSGSPILFDHDADGVRTGTGWLQGDDAWLALDRNANGTIDSGRELFGVDTLITVTETVVLPDFTTETRTFTRTAANGFEALRSLDTGDGSVGSAGHGDNLFDANDADFAKVRLWRDLNQDGISQTGELFTLAGQGIVSISLTPDASTTNLGNGNSINGQAVVTRVSGGSTSVGSVGLAASNLDLATNPFYREFSDSIPLSDEARALPEMGGSGLVRDLREAMSLSPELTAAVTALSGATTRDQQDALLDSVLVAWAETGSRLKERLRMTASWLPLASGPTGRVQFEGSFGAQLDAEGVEWRGLLADALFGEGGNASGTALLQIARDAEVITEWASFEAPGGNITSARYFYVGLPLYKGLAELGGGDIGHIGVLGVFNADEILQRLVTVLTPFESYGNAEQLARILHGLKA